MMEASQKNVFKNLLHDIGRVVEPMRRHGKGISDKHSINCVSNASSKCTLHNCYERWMMSDVIYKGGSTAEKRSDAHVRLAWPQKCQAAR